jgi:hypothetical protein
MEKITIGTKVIYRPAWGREPQKTAIVEGIEHCQRKGDKYGDSVSEISWRDKDYGVYILNDGHWAYGHQIDAIASE